MALLPSYAFIGQQDWLGYYLSLPSGSSFFTLLLRESGLEADDTLIDYTDLATLLLATNDEATFLGYERKPAGVKRTVRPVSNDIFYELTAPITWVKAGSSQGGANEKVAKAVTCWKPTASAADSAIKPCWATRVLGTTDGNDMTFRAPSGLGLADSVQAS